VDVTGLCRNARHLKTASAARWGRFLCGRPPAASILLASMTRCRVQGGLGGTEGSRSLQGDEHSGRRLTSRTRAKENVPQIFVLEKYWPHRRSKSASPPRIHFETLIPWLGLCNARARRAGEGIGHTVHEVTTRSCPFARLRAPVLRGLFSWRRSQKNSPSKGGLPGLPS
jgi:hypothetical protein